MFDVKDKVIFITGASSGIGLHFCELLAAKGAQVIAASRSAERADALQMLSAKHGNSVRPLNMDVMSEASVEAAAKSIAQEFQRVDVVVNNAGSVVLKRILDASLDDWNSVLGTNLTGPLLVSKSLVPLMPRGGSIINIASIGGAKAIVGLSSYAASKAGLMMLSRTMALEWADLSIRVNVISPGYIRTPMNDDYLAGEGGQRLLKKVPLDRFGTPTDLDGALIFLASDASSYMTGGCLLIDGGFLA